MASFENPTKGAKKFRQKARQSENVKNFKIATFLDEFSLVERQDYYRLLQLLSFSKFLVQIALRLHEF